jgi:hypothetical protein
MPYSSYPHQKKCLQPYLQVDNLFSHPTTISRNIIKEAETVKTSLKLILKDIFGLIGRAFTSDM